MPKADGSIKSAKEDKLHSRQRKKYTMRTRARDENIERRMRTSSAGWEHRARDENIDMGWELVNLTAAWFCNTLHVPSLSTSSLLASASDLDSTTSNWHCESGWRRWEHGQDRLPGEGRDARAGVCIQRQRKASPVGQGVQIQHQRVQIQLWQQSHNRCEVSS